MLDRVSLELDISGERSQRKCRLPRGIDAAIDSLAAAVEDADGEVEWTPEVIQAILNFGGRYGTISSRQAVEIALRIAERGSFDN